MEHDLIALVTLINEEEGHEAAGAETHKLEFNSDLIKSEGFTLGSSSRCSIPLPPSPLGSEYHCAITFARSEPPDNEYRLVLRDLSPTHKIRVLYEGDEIPEESSHQWVIAVRDSPDTLHKVSVEMAGQARYEIQPMFSGMDVQDYNQKVKGFLKQQGLCKVTADLPQREFRPLISRDNHLVGLSEIGRGTDGVVTRVVDVTTAQVYARKTPFSNHPNDLACLETEVTMLKEISHVSLAARHPNIDPYPVMSSPAHADRPGN